MTTECTEEKVMILFIVMRCIIMWGTDDDGRGARFMITKNMVNLIESCIIIISCSRVVF